MADLDPLIRLRKHELDEKQKFLARLYDEANRLLAARKEIAASIEKEAKAVQDPEFEQFLPISGFGNFLDASRKKMERIYMDEQKLDVRIQIAINDMRESFGELKKVEITQAQRLEEERRELQAKEDALFEDIALQIHAKNQD